MIDEEKKKPNKGFRLRSRPGTSQSGKRVAPKRITRPGSKNGGVGLVKPKTSMAKKRNPKIVKINSSRPTKRLVKNKLKKVKLNDELSESQRGGLVKDGAGLKGRTMKKAVSEIFGNVSDETYAAPTMMKEYGNVRIKKHSDAKGSFNSSLKSLTLVEGFQFDEELEVFSTRFNPSDTKLAIGSNNLKKNFNFFSAIFFIEILQKIFFADFCQNYENSQTIFLKQF